MQYASLYFLNKKLFCSSSWINNEIVQVYLRWHVTSKTLFALLFTTGIKLPGKTSIFIFHAQPLHISPGQTQTKIGINKLFGLHLVCQNTKSHMQVTFITPQGCRVKKWCITISLRKSGKHDLWKKYDNIIQYIGYDKQLDLADSLPRH